MDYRCVTNIIHASVFERRHRWVSCRGGFLPGHHLHIGGSGQHRGGGRRLVRRGSGEQRVANDGSRSGSRSCHASGSGSCCCGGSWEIQASEVAAGTGGPARLARGGVDGDLILEVGHHHSHPGKLAAEHNEWSEYMTNKHGELIECEGNTALLYPLRVFCGRCQAILVADGITEIGEFDTAATHPPRHTKNTLHYIPSCTTRAAHIVGKVFMVWRPVIDWFHFCRVEHSPAVRSWVSLRLSGLIQLIYSAVDLNGIKWIKLQ